MKAILLAAGYGTRMRPLTEKKAKPLLPIGDRCFLDHALRRVLCIPEVREVYVVSNAYYFDQFLDWQRRQVVPVPLVLVNDGSTSSENRLGAIRDLAFALENAGENDDVIAMGTDNLFGFSFRRLAEFFYRRRTPVITAHRLDDPERLRKTGVVEVGPDGRVLHFEEKPAHPRSNLSVPPVYLLPREALHFVHDYLADSNNPDAPGHFIAWLYRQTPVYVFLFSEPRYTFDTPESYAELCSRWETIRPLLEGET